METFPTPSNPLHHGEHTPSSPGEGEENFEKKPVLKKVKDKVKKIKNTIAKKARSQGDDGNNHDGDQHQHGDLDEGDDGYEEDEEVSEDAAVHGGQDYGSSTVDARIGEKERDRGLGNEGGAYSVHGSSMAGKSTGANEMGGGGRNEVKSVGLSGIKPELKEDPAAPNSSTRTEMEQSRGGEEAAISPEVLSSLEAIGTSRQNDGLSKDLSDDNNRSNVSVIPGAKEKGGEGGAISPELHRSFNAMSVSDRNGGGEAEVPQNKNSGYTGKITAAKDAAFSAASESAVLGKKVASMVYQKAGEAGTAVMARVKPETGNDGVKPEILKDDRDVAAAKQDDRDVAAAKQDDRDVAAAKQDKGGSVKDYVSGKLTPGEEDKALSEVITEALTPRKGGTVEAGAAPASPEKSGSGGSGGGIGVVGRIKETVTSFLGGGGSPRQSPAADESKDFLGKTPEALSQEKAP